MIEIFRIDEGWRDGQVAIGWTPSVNANTMLIVNKEVENEKTKARAME